MTQLKELTRPQITYPANGSVVPVERAVWQQFKLEPVEPGISPRLAGKRIVVAGGSGETAERLAAALTAGGAKVFRFNPTGNVEEAGTAFKQLTGPVDGIIDLNVSEATAPTAAESWQTALRQSVTLLKLYYEEWAAATDATRLFYLPVTRLGGRMGFAVELGEVEQPFGGIWAGLAKTLPREIPNINVKILDFAAGDYRKLGEIVTSEIYRWGLFEIGYRDGQRYGLACHNQPALPQEIELGPGDTILVSGGSRGIGHAMAKNLARNYGCRVIVTGRSPLPAPTAWLEMDEAAFKNYTQQLYKNIPAGKRVGEVRREVEELKRQKELYDNMQAIRAEGLPVEYRVCDFTSAGHLNELLADLGDTLSGVIHNAGVDTPVRLPSKTPEGFVQTLGIKLTGFMNLFAAVKDRPLKFFNCTGSLTGRWGGMVGQLDYASGNEGLARLAMWAAPQVSYPLKSLSWPTWDRLGMIANFEATLKYMSAVDVEEGLYHWTTELLSKGRGEVCFNGPVGAAVTPAHLYGFPLFSEVPQAERLYSPLFFTGEILDFQIFNSTRAVSRIEPLITPAMSDFTVNDRPALPVSLVLEYALSLAEWLAPEGWPKLNLEAVEDLEVEMANLVGGFALVKQAAGAWQQGKWGVALELFASDSKHQLPQRLARLKVVFTREDARRTTASPVETSGQPVKFEKGMPLAWNGHIFKPVAWQRGHDGKLSGRVQPLYEADLWTTPFLPTLKLPATALENTWQASLNLARPANLARLQVKRLNIFPGSFRSGGILQGEPSGENWTFYNDVREKILEVEGISWQ